MTPRLAIAILYGLLSVVLAASLATVELPAVRLVVRGWCALACGLVALAYLADRPAIFGKRPDGTVGGWMRPLVLPVVGFSYLGLLIRTHLSPEPPYHEVAPGLFLGRRVPAAKLPEGVDLVVDLTSEFGAAPGVREARRYRCEPTLDGSLPPDEAFATLAGEVADHPGRVYVHCAAGHGRAMVVTAGALVLRGIAADGRAAIAHLRAIRPRITVHRVHRELVDRTCAPPSAG